MCEEGANEETVDSDDEPNFDTEVTIDSTDVTDEDSENAFGG